MTIENKPVTTTIFFFKLTLHEIKHICLYIKSVLIPLSSNPLFSRIWYYPSLISPGLVRVN